ncbi:serine-protein kinase ATM isoform X2 [Periplaneta americana]|uniref:serine-protein kinase ATM isoform X2 n=1 Tax=Periplaneta americana TaxID=6978 RepID=UPI0037E702A5
MAAIQNDLLECSRNCDSSKITDRKKAMERLSVLLDDPRAILLLNRAKNDELTWDKLFSSVHELILREAERFRSDEQKAQSASSLTNRENVKIKCSALIDKLVTKAVKGSSPKLKCSTVQCYILRVLNDRCLCRYFGCTYLLILQTVLTVRKYWGDINSEDWNDLMDTCFVLYENPPVGMDKSTMANILNSIVKYGTSQSHLGLRLRKKIPLLVQAFENPNLEKLPALQAALLQLALTVSQKLAKESRLITCKFGEDITKCVVGLYEHRLEDRYDKKGLIFDFLLLQMHLHHPHGSREGDGAAYAYNWEKWRHELKLIYSLVDTEMHNIQRSKGRDPYLRENFLKLAVEVCKQIFEDSSNVLDVTNILALNDSTFSVPPKRRRVVTGIQAILDAVNVPNRTQAIWPWFSLLTSLFSKYPNALKEEDFLPLLRQVAELLSTCKDPILMGYLCQCCESLLKVEQYMNNAQLNLKEANLLWLRIWETTLRTVGLTQSEESSHKLLQALILKKNHPPTVLLHMFLKGTIQLSEQSLQTLLVILKYCDIPETDETFHSFSLTPPFVYLPNQGSDSLRCALLDWILPNKDDVGIPELNLVPCSPMLMSRVLVELIVRSQCDSVDSDNDCVYSKEFMVNSIEDDYMISSFEMGLLVEDSREMARCSDVKSNQSTRLVITSPRDKLLELLNRDCCALTERVAMPPDSSTKLKIVTDYISQCLLILCTLSWMLKWNIITSQAFPTCSLTNAVRKMMDQLATPAKGLLVTSKMETNLSVVLNMLQKTRQLFEVEIHESVMKFAQEAMPLELLDAVYKITKMKVPQARNNMELNQGAFLMKEDDEDDDVVDSANPPLSEEASCSLLDVRLLTENEKVQAEAVGLLCSYSCCFTGKTLSDWGNEALHKLLKVILDDQQPKASLYYFQMAVSVVQRALACLELQDHHVASILEIIQTLCRGHYKDHEAALILNMLLRDVFKHLKDTKSRENSVVILKAFQKRVNLEKYGPDICIHYVRCLGELAKVDPNFSWATWNSGTEDRGVERPIAEELLVHIKSPFHEMRMTAASFIGSLFGTSSIIASDTSKQFAWQTKMFEKLCVFIMSSYQVTAGTVEENMDESANRTASALHSFAALIVISPYWRKRAMFAMLQLVKEKNLNTDLVRKVLNLVGKSLKLSDIKKLTETYLNYILIHWQETQYALKDFPWVVFDCTSDTEFFSKYQEVIIPVLLRKEDNEALDLVSRKVGKMLAELVTVCYPRIIACQIPCFAASASDGLKDTETKIAKQLLTRLEQILTKDTITELLNQQLDKVIVNIMRLLFDPQHFSKLCGGCRETLSDPDPPHFKFTIIMKSLLYLQENSPKPGLSLVVYFAKETPERIQKILLCLAVDIHRVPTLEDKLKSLHRYVTFAHILISELHADGTGLGNMASFIIRDVSHTLIHLVKQEEQPLAVAACHFYKQFCSKCFPSCASVIKTFLRVIVSILVPLAKLSDELGAESRELLRFLVVENSEHLTSAIEMLDPFPGDEIFEEMQAVYSRTVQTKRKDTLEDTIKHFLNAGNKNLGCREEGLKHLRTQLSEKKTELCLLYKELNDMRGFSEDCAKSLLHQLMFMLVELTSVPDPKIRLEASRCLGELGPADLTTMILKPEKSLELQGNDFRNNPVLVFTSHVVGLLVDYMVDENIDVVEAASNGLYQVLKSYEGQQVVGASGFDSHNIIPFKADKKTKRQSSLVIDEDLFKTTVDMENLWCPMEECSHEKWVTTLVSTILKTFAQENCYISQLVPICNVKVSFAEQLLPMLVSLVLSTGHDICRTVMNRCVCYFFRQHFDIYLQLEKDRITSPVPVLKHVKQQVCFNKASVQCMLNVVHFARLQKNLKPGQRNGGTSSQHLELNYLHIAQAAQFCSAYFTSILYAELWCDETRESNASDCVVGQSLSALEYICERNADNGVALQNILREAYKKIGDNDAIYGCGSSHLMDPQSRIRHYELVGDWQNALQSYDSELCSGNKDATAGMLIALKNLGLYHIQYRYLCSEKSSEFEDHLYECSWRLGHWNLPSAANNRKFSYCPIEEPSSGLESLRAKLQYEKYHCMALKTFHELDFAGVENSVAAARKCVIDSLAHASLECSKNLYIPLSQLQSLQEIEDFVSAFKSREAARMVTVLDKWKKQGQLNLNEFQYVEPILSQRAVVLNDAMQRGGEIGLVLRNNFVEIQLSTSKLARVEGWHHVGKHCLESLSNTGALSPVVRGRISLEEAQLLWERGSHEIGRCLLRSLLGDLALSGDVTREDKLLYSSALTLYGNWMAETKSENSQVIVERYFSKAQNILEGIEYKEESWLEAYSSLARFMDAEYQQLMCMLKSSAFESKQQFMIKAREEADKLYEQKKRTRDEERKIQMCRKMSVIDGVEMKNRQNEKDQYLKLALENYLLSLEHGTQSSLQVFRLTSLWLENTAHEDVSVVMERHLHRIPSYKFLPVVPQLAPRISNNMADPFVRKLNALLERCAVEHPHHTLPVILALANSYRDQEFTGGSTQNERPPEPRVLGAQHILQCLKSNEKCKEVLVQMEVVATALISLAYATYDTESRAKSFPIQRAILKQLRGSELVLVPTMTIPVRNNGEYNDIVGIHRYVENFTLVGGVNAPKKIACIGTDGVERPQLVKGKDDLRQDAVMQQVFTILNTLLKNNKETKKRKLLIRTYKVVPLSQRSGILEWCQNTEPMANITLAQNGTHRRYYPQDNTPQTCRKSMIEVAGATIDVKLKTYKAICERFHPAFRFFFLENFPTPGVWFERRLAYIHSVATSSMIGYILGLGDRHPVNILIDKSTAEVIHIDFGIAFEQGQILPTPETVPFRLTRDLEDGMGVSGIEGVFRRCCEKTMSVLRQNQETILTILEVLLYDPLYAWTISPAKAYTIQQQEHKADIEYSDPEANVGEVNRMAERALVRLRQKLQGTEEGTAASVGGQVNRLLQQARDPGNLSRLFHGWQPYA